LESYQKHLDRAEPIVSEITKLKVADDVELVKNVLIPMLDGVRLAADLYMPAASNGTERWPVVVEYTPYRKDDVQLASRPFYLTFPRQGYVVARIDIRGTGASEGFSTDEYTLREQHDGFAAVEWLAQQPWCDGQVNMMGISYGGFTALQVAALAPPHLKSIIPIYFTDDRYTDDCHYRGGLLRKYYDIAHYGGQMVARNAMPPYPEWSGDNWARLWEQHLNESEPYLLEWFRHQTDGEYWRNGSVRDVADQIRCPAFLIGGWRDGYPNPPLRLYQLLKGPKKVLIGPWNHVLPDTAIPGPRIDYVREALRWLDYWCRGEDNGILDEPPIVVYMQRFQPPDPDRLDTPGDWRAEKSWPPPGAEKRTFYLGGEGTLNVDPPQDDAPASVDAYEYNPTVGLTAGLWSGGIPFGLPGDQRRDEAYSLVYTTPPLVEDMHILGSPRFVLYVSSTASVMGFAASLCDVAPDGTSHLIAKGMLNATRRDSFASADPLHPGEIYRLEIPIDCTGWTFSKGHFIRLSIASADWPNVWPTPECGSNRVHRSPEYLSRLILPLVPAEGSAAPPQFKTSKRTISPHREATKPPVWQFTQDQISGRTTVTLFHSNNWRVNDTITIEREASSTFEVDPARPSDASAKGCHLYRIVRPNQEIQSKADLSVQATNTHFHLIIQVEVRVNGALHFTKHWAETVPRHYL
jgi:hypothetical protein